MNSTLNPKQTDDPHDVVMVPPDVALVAPDVALVAPTDEELSRLAKMAQEASRKPADPLTATASGLAAGPTVPPVDTTFRPAAVAQGQQSMVRRAAGAFTALLLAGCIGVAAVAWQINRDAAKRLIARWAPQFVASSLSRETPAQPAPPAVQAAAANAAPPQSAALNQTAPQGVAPAAAPSVESAPVLQSMARDVASLGQEVAELKATIEQLKAGQQQISRDVAKVGDAKASEVKPPPRPAAARPRRPTPSYYPPYQSPQAAAAPASPAAAPHYAPRQEYAPRQDYYAPRQPDPQPQTAAEPPADAEASSVPRPPMPVR
jgi:hypothetical protein